MRVSALTLGWMITALSGARAQARTIRSDDGCDRDRGHRDRGWYCEVRELTLPAARDLMVDADPNGGIAVHGGDRGDVQLRARVATWARDDDAAHDLAQEVRIVTDRGTIRADGPSRRRHESWSVNFELFVPERSNLDLHTLNGGVEIEDVTGTIVFHTTNGGVRLTRLGGNVRGSATNGGLDVELAGARWEGDGLDVETTNGGIVVSVPDDYSARLVTGTINGGLRVDFPITVQGRLNRHITTDLGAGGRTLRVITTNGSVAIRRRGGT